MTSEESVLVGQSLLVFRCLKTGITTTVFSILYVNGLLYWGAQWIFAKVKRGEGMERSKFTEG